MIKEAVAGGIFFFSLFGVLLAQATDYSSTNFIIRDPVISTGGVKATSTTFQVFSSLGQTAIGQSTSTDFTIRSGFLYYPEPETSSSGGTAGGGHVIQLYYSPATVTSGRLISEIQGITFSGKAYPNAKITLLKDAQFAGNTVAARDSSFSFSLPELSAGNYLFGLYAEDDKEIRSLLQTYPITVVLGQNVNVEGILMAPALALDKSEVRKSDPITLYGQSAPNAIVTIVINSNSEFLQETKANENGNYSYAFNTASLSFGKYSAKSRALFEGANSPFSRLVTFIVGSKNVTAPRLGELAKKSDVNGDGQVNLVDLSILVYWYGRQTDVPFPAALDLNNNGEIDLTDFSIMAFYWSG